VDREELGLQERDGGMCRGHTRSRNLHPVLHAARAGEDGVDLALGARLRVEREGDGAPLPRGPVVDRKLAGASRGASGLRDEPSGTVSQRLGIGGFRQVPVNGLDTSLELSLLLPQRRSKGVLGVLKEHAPDAAKKLLPARDPSALFGRSGGAFLLLGDASFDPDDGRPDREPQDSPLADEADAATVDGFDSSTLEDSASSGLAEHRTEDLVDSLASGDGQDTDPLVTPATEEHEPCFSRRPDTENSGPPADVCALHDRAEKKALALNVFHAFFQPW
jgi:hypothetical protein